MTPFDPLGALPRGTSLIEAGAGTGKTYTISTLFVRLLLEEQLEIGQILVVTYTEAATAELKDRIRRRLMQTARAIDSGSCDDETLAGVIAQLPDRDAARRRLAVALAAFDEAAVFTIHGFCHRALADHAVESGEPFTTELVPDLGDLEEEIVADFWTGELAEADPLFVRLLRTLGVTPDTLRSLLGMVTRDPDLRVIPDDPEPWLPNARELFESAVGQTRDTWSAHRGEVVRLLTTSTAIKRSVYRKDRIAQWASQLDDVFARAPARALLHEKLLQRFAISSIAAAEKKGETAPRHVFFLQCDELVASLKRYSETLRRQVIALQRKLVAHGRQELPRRKRRLGVLSFDDLLGRLDAALSSPRGEALARSLRERFRAALVDEFQDTDPVQYRILERLFAATRLLLIGDPKQSIYAFRGADVFAYLRAADRPDVRRSTLGVNYRSSPRLVAAVNMVFMRPERPFLVEGIDFRAARPAPGSRDVFTVNGQERAPLELLLLSAEEAGSTKGPARKSDFSAAVTRGIASEVADLLRSDARIDGRRIGPRNVAVLVRTNAEAAGVQETLGDAGIPAVIHGAASVFTSPTAAELLEVLHAAAEPTRFGPLRGALTTQLLGRDGAAIEELARDEQEWDRVLSRFRGWNETWARHGFVRAARRLLEDERIPARLLRLPDGERRLTDLRHLIELLHAASMRERLGPSGLLRWFARQIDEGPDSDSEQLRLDSDDDAVQVLTVHRSKGLEFDVVFCPFLWGNAGLRRRDKLLTRFHDPARKSALTLDIGSQEHAAHREIAEGEALAEALRHLYVALTRAKHACTVVWGNVKGGAASALGYVLHGGAAASDAGRAKVLSEMAVARLEEEAMFTDLEQLAETSREAIVTRRWIPVAPERGATPTETPEALEVRTMRRVVDDPWRVSSFSQLIAGADAPLPAAEGIDRDEASLAPVHESAPGVPAAKEIALADFPRGARAGSAIHAILEHADWSADDAALLPLIEKQLRVHGFSDAAERAEQLAGPLRETLATPLEADDGAPCLRDLAPAARIHELAFLFPVGGARRITPAGLARVFRRHGTHLPATFCDSLEALGFLPLEGFLKGFVDLVFEHDGRFHLADFKSNHLGASTDDYGPEALEHAMVEGRYLLQAHLYALALHRYLGWRIPDYDYDRHFGSAYFLFLRGMNPTTGAARGVYRTRPPRALIEALDELARAADDAASDDPTSHGAIDAGGAT